MHELVNTCVYTFVPVCASACAHATCSRQAEQESSDDEHNYTLSLDHVDKEAVLELSSGARKFFTTLPVSVNGSAFEDIEVQVDSAATCNTMPYSVFRKLGTAKDLGKSSATLVSYCGETIKSRGKANLLYSSPEGYDTIEFEVVDLPGKPALLGLPDSMRLSLISFDKSRVFSSASSANGEAYSCKLNYVFSNL